MDNNELKIALLNRKPVILKSREGHEAIYKYVSAIRYTADNENIVVSVEITDVNGNSVTVCKPDKLRFKE